MGRSAVKVIIFLGLLCLQFTKVTAADMSTTKRVAKNEWSATTLAFSNRDTANDQNTNVLFNVSGLKPGGYQVRTVRVKNDGAMKFGYSLKTEMTGGDENLCNNLEIKILENWQTKFDGAMKNLNLGGQVENAGSEDWIISLGLTNNDPSLSGKTCGFNLHFKTNTNGLSDEKKVESTVSSGSW